MNWIEAIYQWRRLSPEQQRQIRRRRLPHKVARSMAFEGEPVNEQMLRNYLNLLIAQHETEHQDMETKSVTTRGQTDAAEH